MAVRPDEGKGMGGAIRRVPDFFNQVETERKKVAWPTRRETMMTAVMVVVMTTVLALFFFGVDQVFNQIVKLLLSLIA